MFGRFILGREDAAHSQSYIWYSIGGMLDAMQSALLLMVISRTNGQDGAGVYSIGYAIASLAFALGCFGMRNYQASDISHKYSFRTYTSTRILTALAMLVLAAYYCVKGILFTGYTMDKCLVIMLVTALKLVDVIEDHFHRTYQLEGRLDIAGRCLATRMMAVIGAFAIGLIVTRSLVWSAFIGLIVSIAWFLMTTSIVYRQIGKGTIMNSSYDKTIRIKLFDKSNVSLLMECAALFLGLFSVNYVGNCPKYAIDAYCTSAQQASYNYIFMPVYVLFMVGQFAYQPLLTKLASCHKDGDHKGFMKLFWRQIMIITIMVLVVVIGAYFLGTWALGLVFGADLSAYRWPLIILLASSGLLATADYLNVTITILGKQHLLAIGYGIAILASMVLARPIVAAYGVLGASILYASVMAIECLVFGIIFLIKS